MFFSFYCPKRSFEDLLEDGSLVIKAPYIAVDLIEHQEALYIGNCTRVHYSTNGLLM
jgi:hypothetical protein